MHSQWSKSLRTWVIAMICVGTFQFLNAQPKPTLRALADSRGISVGAAIGASPFWQAPGIHHQTLAREFNMIVPENYMKWDLIEPSQGQFDFMRTDSIVSFAQSHQMKIRGHALVWHQQSGWIEKATSMNRAQMIAAMRSHIEKVASRYRGKILEWDVVNEAIDDGGGYLRSSFWSQRFGEDFLDSAFVFAHRADPEALLFYNDYGAEGMNAKSDKVFKLVKTMKEKGIPIHGVGLQAHFDNSNPNWQASMADIDKNIKRIAALGLRVSVTELDLRIQKPVTDEKLALQKKNYADWMKVCLANSNCKSILTWGFTDAHSWIDTFFPGYSAGLLFDAQYQPKPAVEGFREALLATPTRLLRVREFAPHQAMGRAILYLPTTQNSLRQGGLQKILLPLQTRVLGKR